MVDSIDLTGGKGEFDRQREEKNRVPPPAQLPPGVSGGNPPLPTGRAVRAIDPKRLSPLERTKLEAVGWKEGEPVPDNMADIIAGFEQKAQSEVQGELPLPADPSTPPIQFTPVPIEDMPPEQRAKAKAMVDESLAAAAGHVMSEQRQATESRSQIAQAGGHQVQMSAAPPAPPARPATGSVPDVDHVAQAAPPPQATPQMDETPAASPEPSVDPEAPSEAPQAPEADPGSAAMAYCPHCGWDMAAEDIPDPEEEDRLTFLQSVLGQQSFQKRYKLFGGAMVVGFRTLTSQEIDAVYKQVFQEREDGELKSDIEYWERINRYRLYLQIAFTQAGDKLRELPDGLSKETSPHCTGVWKTADGVAPLKAIEQYLLHEILTTETLSRIIQNTCAQFNRLVAKMEAMIENPDFWKETEQLA